jgi:predicted acylesterase/phospholipase RssA
MEQPIQLQFVFQGGGAKLVPLLAAAHAVHDQADNLGYSVKRVSGASAGAVVAAMLAMGLDPAVFRERLLRLATTHMDQIIKPFWWGSYVRALFGQSIYDSRIYRKLLHDLFANGPEIPHLKNRKIDIFIHATDIKNGTYKHYTGDNPEDTVEEALFSSSAIPFLFQNFKDRGSFIDGGLIDNFPTEALLADVSAKGDVVGFSFRRTEPYRFDTGLKSYLASIVFTAMDYSVERSMKQMPAENVYFIPTTLTTLDFQRALQELKELVRYEQYKLGAEAFLKELIARQKAKIAADKVAEAKAAEAGRETVERQQGALTELEDRNRETVRETQQLINKLRILHKANREANDFTVKKVVYFYRCNALKIKDLRNPASRDELRCEDHIILHKDLQGYGVSIRSGEASADVGEFEFRITDTNDNEIHHGVSVTLPAKYTTGEISDEHNVLLFLPQPLSAENKKGYKISFSCYQEQVLYGLIQPSKMDGSFFATGTTQKVEEVNLIFYIPTELPTPTLRDSLDLAPKLMPRDIRTGIESLVQANYQLVRGEPMSEADLTKFMNVHPGFKPIGWKAANLGKKTATAFVAFAGDL